MASLNSAMLYGSSMEEQIKQVVNTIGQRNGFPSNSINVDVLRSASYDGYEIRLSYGRCYSVVELSGHTLLASAVGELPMICEMLERSIVGLRDETIRSAGNVQENYRFVYNPFCAGRLEDWIPKSIPEEEPFNKDDIVNELKESLNDMRSWIESLEDQDILSEWDGRVEELFISFLGSYDQQP